MPNFANAVQKAIDKVAAIEGFGQNVTVRTITAGSYNTTTGVIAESNSCLLYTSPSPRDS